LKKINETEARAILASAKAAATDVERLGLLMDGLMRFLNSLDLETEFAANPERFRRTATDVKDLAVKIELALQGPRHMWPPPDAEEG
jgi:hypothetical protein